VSGTWRESMRASPVNYAGKPTRASQSLNLKMTLGRPPSTVKWPAVCIAHDFLMSPLHFAECQQLSIEHSTLSKACMSRDSAEIADKNLWIESVTVRLSFALRPISFHIVSILSVYTYLQAVSVQVIRGRSTFLFIRNPTQRLFRSCVVGFH